MPHSAACVRQHPPCSRCVADRTPAAHAPTLHSCSTRFRVCDHKYRKTQMLPVRIQIPTTTTSCTGHSPPSKRHNSSTGVTGNDQRTPPPLPTTSRAHNLQSAQTYDCARANVIEACVAKGIQAARQQRRQQVHTLQPPRLYSSAHEVSSAVSRAGAAPGAAGGCSVASSSTVWCVLLGQQHSVVCAAALFTRLRCPPLLLLRGAGWSPLR